MSVFNQVVWAVTLVGSVINLPLQYTRLDTRRGTRVSQLISAPRGILVRIWLLVATASAMQLIARSAAWPVLAGLWIGIIAWEGAVQATAWIRRARHRRASRA
ncbi:MAG: hypothetical protein J2P28_08410 [Actinobacteria bacterium]|nr:hypothetical protein [Actinomycetota bacterium]